MMRPNTYLITLRNILTKPAYYLVVVKAKFWFVFRFFCLSMILLGLLMALRINQRLVPQLENEISQALRELKDNYPEELRLEWTGAKLKLSTEELVVVDYPSNWHEILPVDLQQPEKLAYLTGQNLATDELSQNMPTSSWLVIDQDQIYFSDFNQNWSGQPLTSFFTESQTINSANLDQIISKLEQNIQNYSQTARFVTYLVTPMLLLVTTLWALLIETVILFLLFKLNRLTLTFNQTFKLSLQVGVVAELVNQISAWLYPELRWPMFALTFWLVTIYVIWSQRKQFYQVSRGNNHKKKK